MSNMRYDPLYDEKKVINKYQKASSIKSKTVN